jgi:mannose-6-phosphate isomerase-like protein (cupin superfamily)
MTRIAIHESEVEGVKKTPWPRVSKVLISEHTFGAKQISMGLNISEPGSGIPMHKHTVNEEALFVLEGTGKLKCGDQETDLVPGTAFFSPLGVDHEVRNTGNVPLKILWAYAPPLPDHLKK